MNVLVRPRQVFAFSGVLNRPPRMAWPRSCGIPVTEEQRSQFLSCTDLKQLKSWLERVGTVSSAEKLFD
jgi:hypothetical protein